MNSVRQYGMHNRSMFAIYLYEDEAGQVSVRADSFGEGEKVLSLGFDLIERLVHAKDSSGGELLMLLPVDRCHTVQ